MCPNPVPAPLPSLVRDYVDALSNDLSEWDKADEAAALFAELPKPKRES